MSGDSILVVDDDEDLCTLVASVLEGEGYSVRTATNGAEALREVKAHGPPDLVLLDMKMPVMDGWEFARRFRAEVDQPAPVVVLSAAENPAQRAREIAASGWLGKPFELDALLEVVSRNLADKRSSTARHRE